MATAWNASDSLNTSLDATKLIATSSSGQAAIRADQGRSSGQYYWEYTFTNATHGDTGCGIANATAPLNLTGSNATGACFIYKGFPVYFNGSNTGISIGTVSTGTVVGIAVDFIAQKIWFRVAPSGNWNGNAAYDPAAGTGGISYAAIATSAIFPAASMWQTNDSIKANFGATAFVGAIPAGFTSEPSTYESVVKVTAYAPIIQGEELETVKAYSVLQQGEKVGTVKAYGVIQQGGISALNVRAYAVLTPTKEIVTQVAVEEWATQVADVRITQIAVEQWTAQSTRMQLTQVAVEEWAAQTTDLRLTQIAVEVWTAAGQSIIGVAGAGAAGTLKGPFIGVSATGQAGRVGSPTPTLRVTHVGINTWVQNITATPLNITQVGTSTWVQNTTATTPVRVTHVSTAVWVRADAVALTGVSAIGKAGNPTPPPANLRVTQLGSSAWVRNTAAATPFRATQVGASAWVQNAAPPFRATQVGASIWVRRDASVVAQITGVSGTAQLGVTSNQVQSAFLQKGLIGQAATSQLGNLGKLITVPLTGMSATGRLGSLEPSQRAPSISMILSASRSGIGSVFVVEDAARISMVTGIGAVVNAPMTTRQLTGVSALGLASDVKLPSAMRGITAIGQVGTEQVSITLRLSGVNGSALIHNVVANVAIPVTGVFATALIHAVSIRQFTGTRASGLAGVLGKRLDDQIKGVRGTGLAGSAQAQEPVPITGVSGNGSSGHVVPSITVRLASVSAKGFEGHFPVVKRLIGVSATGLVGNLTEALAALMGVKATGLVGFINKAIADRIIGVQCKGFVAGIRGASRITGVYGTGRCGSLSAGDQITGVQGFGRVGNIVIIRYVKGLFATALLGALRPVILIRITGNQAVGQIGQVTPHSFGDMTLVHITGVACIGYVGRVTPHSFGDKTFVPITGVGGVGQVGRATTRMRGAQGTGRCGKLSVRITLRLNGLFARGRAGVLVPQGSKHRYWQIAILANDGGSIYSMAEVQFRSVPDNPLLFTGGTAGATQSATSAAYATDDDTSTYWSSFDTNAGQDWRYDYGAGNGLNVLQISITARCDNDTGYLEAPSSFNLRWSDNGLSWITVGTFVTTWTERCQTQVFDVTELETALQLTGTAREAIVMDDALASLSSLVLETITENDVTALIAATIREVLRTSDLQPTRITVDMVLREIVNVAASRGLLSNMVRETLDVGRGTISLENMAREVITMAMSSTTIRNLVREIIDTTIASLQVYGLVCEVLRDPNVAPTRIEVVGMARESVMAALTSAELAGLICEVIAQVEAVSQWSGVVREVLRTPDAAPIRIEVDGIAREALVDSRGRAQSSTLARETTVMLPAALRMDRLARETLEILPAEILVNTIVHEVMDIVDAQMWMSTMALELLRSTSSKPTEIIANTLAWESVYISTSIMEVATMVFETMVKTPVDKMHSSAVARETVSREIAAMKVGGVVREVLIAGRVPPVLINVSVNM